LALSLVAFAFLLGIGKMGIILSLMIGKEL
jgi:hypothetical protein